jgi:hypothetical protein
MGKTKVMYNTVDRSFVINGINIARAEEAWEAFSLLTTKKEKKSWLVLQLHGDRFGPTKSTS